MLGTACELARRLMIAELQHGLSDQDREFLDSHIRVCSACRELSVSLYHDHSLLNRWGLGDLALARATVTHRQSFARVVKRFLLHGLIAVFVMSLALATLGVFVLDLFSEAPIVSLSATAINLRPKAPKPDPSKTIKDDQHNSDEGGFVTVASAHWLQQSRNAYRHWKTRQLLLVRQASLKRVAAQIPTPRPAAKPVAPAAKPKKAKKQAPNPFANTNMNPQLLLVEPEVPKGPKEFPAPLASAVHKLGIDPGLNYDKLYIFPIVNHTTGTKTVRVHRSRVSKVTASELPNFEPHRLAVQATGPFSPWPIFPGLILESNAGLRVTNDYFEAGAEATAVRVFTVADPDQVVEQSREFRRVIYRPKVLLAPAVLPSGARAEFIAGADTGTLRRAVWNFFLPPGRKLHSSRHFVPNGGTEVDAVNSRYFRYMRVVIDEMREFSHLVRVEFAKISGFRGMALSIAGRPVSIDVFRDTETALAAIDSLLIGLAMEAYVENNFIPTYAVSRNILKNQYFTLDYHKFMYAQVRKLQGQYGQSTYRKTFRDQRLHLEIAVESADDQNIEHLCVIAR